MGRLRSFFARAIYDEQLHRELYGAWRHYPYAMRNTVALCLLVGLSIGWLAAWVVFA